MIKQSFTTSSARMPASGRAAAVGRQSPATLLLIAMAGTLLVSACSINPRASTDADSIAAATSPALTSAGAVQQNESLPFEDRAMIDDIIGFTLQIFPPFNTTLQFRRDDADPLLQRFVDRFAGAGYGIQRVSADQGSNFFSYNRVESESEGGEPVVSLDTTIGAVNIGRDYSVLRDDLVTPVSPVRLSGTRIPVVVADQPSRGFERNQDPEVASAVYVGSFDLEEQVPPVISLLTDDLISRVANQATAQTSLQALNSSRMEVNNLFFADESNFTSLLDGYEPVDRQIIVFGNDSMILGDINKKLIEQLVEERVQPNDLIGLVGCSNGPTALDIGNEGLAMGRAQRVTQALLSQGIARERILDEGCWAPVSAGDKFPSRGVVLELWRKA